MQSQGAHVLFYRIKDMLEHPQCLGYTSDSPSVMEALRALIRTHFPWLVALACCFHYIDLMVKPILALSGAVAAIAKAKGIATMIKRQAPHAIFMHILQELNAEEYKKAGRAKARGKAYTLMYVHTLKFAGTTRKISNVSTLCHDVQRRWQARGA
eukprot:2719401-Rhodomonas_salina.1